MGSKYEAPAARRVLGDSVKRIDRILADPVASKSLRRKDQVLRGYKSDKARLQSITPPDADGATKAKLLQRNAQLEQAMIMGNPKLGIDPMCTKRAMEEMPAGAVGQHGRWEQRWKKFTLAEDGQTVVPAENGRGAIYEWKDNQRTARKDQEEDDPDVGNIEMFRPDGAESIENYRSRSFSPGLQLTQEQYDAAFPGHQPTDVERKIRDYEERLAQMEALLLKQETQPELPAKDTADRCEAINSGSGKPCKRKARKGSTYCGIHARRG